MTDLRMYDLAQGQLGWAVFFEQVEQRELHFLQRGHWQTELTRYPVDADGVVAFRDSGHGSDEVLLEGSGALARVLIEGGEVYVTAAGDSSQEAAAMVAELRAVIRATPLDEDGLRPVTFWTYSPHGPASQTRRITVPTWDEIDGNYGRVEQLALDELMRSHFRPAAGGQLILWQGPAGTGKTWALRALAWEWRDWADFHYIVDPDKFFGDHADYLTTVIFHDDSQDEPITWKQGEKLPVPAKPKDRWKVLILEDSGEMLSADAKERVGQALSRLLNVVDGLIGQGLRVLVLVTTNEPVKRLHEAVARPGRCAAKIEFGALDRESSARWLGEHDHEGEVEQAMTLAELYALIAGRPAHEARTVGFA